MQAVGRGALGRLGALLGAGATFAIAARPAQESHAGGRVGDADGGRDARAALGVTVSSWTRISRTPYGVPTKALNQAVKRNRERFPGDFCFRLTAQEVEDLKSQSVTSSEGWGGRRRSRPLAFTEHGAIMAASVLNSPRAVQMVTDSG